jgi:multicomponent Na+:H+ antiporter subunit C
MDYALAALAGLFLTAAIYLLLARSLIRMLLGLVLLGNAVNLVILVGGRLSRLAPPIALGDEVAPAAAAANPLPQALILTAIVIGFAMFAFLLVLAWRAYQSLEADDTDQMRVAEPPGRPDPPMSY